MILILAPHIPAYQRVAQHIGRDAVARLVTAPGQLRGSVAPIIILCEGWRSRFTLDEVLVIRKQIEAARPVMILKEVTLAEL